MKSRTPAADSPSRPRHWVMRKMKRLMCRLAREESGQDVAEYAFILALIALGTIVVTGHLGSTIANTLMTYGSRLTNSV